MKNASLWDATLCGSCMNRCFGGTYQLHHQSDKNRRARNNVSGNYQLKHAAKISDYGGDMFLRNVSSYKSHTAQHPSGRHSSYTLVVWIYLTDN
jgi:succinylglutamate desuccinylase